jgi:hypothetical protein
MSGQPTAQALPPLVQDAGVPFDVFIQALTEQLDKAQATMALKARVGKLPMTFAVKDVSLDLRAFIRIVQDDVYVRPAGPGDAGASSVKLVLTTITRPMIEENAMSFQAEDPKFSLREALGDHINEEDQRSLERIGVRSIGQLNELRQAAGADVVARLARMPVNRLQQAMLAASAPRVTRVDAEPVDRMASSHVAQPGGGATRESQPVGGTIREAQPAGSVARDAQPAGIAPRALPLLPARVHIEAPLLQSGRVPLVRAGGMAVPIVQAQDQSLVLQPLAHQLGSIAELDFGDGRVAEVRLAHGSVGQWQALAAAPGMQP